MFGGLFGGALGSAIKGNYKNPATYLTGGPGWWNGAMLGGEMYGGLFSRADSQANAERNIELQRQFAQHGIRWKVEDAKRAGIHPLYALGAQGSTFQPVDQVGGSGFLGEMGQNLARSFGATQSQQERALGNLQIASMKADVEGKALDNQIRAKQLAIMNSPTSVGPGLPNATNFIPGQGNSNVKINPSERTASQSGRFAQEAGWVPDVGYARTDTGLAPIPSRDVKERIEDQLIPEAMWAGRNLLVPNLTFGSVGKPPANQLPEGANDWSWSYWKQEWQPVYRRRSSGRFRGTMRSLGY